MFLFLVLFQIGLAVRLLKEEKFVHIGDQASVIEEGSLPEHANLSSSIGLSYT